MTWVVISFTYETNCRLPQFVFEYKVEGIRISHTEETYRMTE